MQIKHTVIVFDAADLAAESSFWSGLLGVAVDAEDDWHMVMIDGQPRVGVQLAPDHVAPVWPGGSPKQQMHLDLWVEDIDEARALVHALGADLLQPAADEETPDAFELYADPATPSASAASAPGRAGYHPRARPVLAAKDRPLRYGLMSLPKASEFRLMPGRPDVDRPRPPSLSVADRCCQDQA